MNFPDLKCRIEAQAPALIGYLIINNILLVVGKTTLYDKHAMVNVQLEYFAKIYREHCMITAQYIY